MPLILPEPRSITAGLRGLTHWWPLDAPSRMGAVTIPRGYGSVYGTLTTIGPVTGPPFATSDTASSFTVGTSNIALSAAPHAFGGASNTPFSISFWAYLNSFTAFDASVLGRFICWGTSANSDEITVMTGAAGNGSIEFRTVEGGATTIQQTTGTGLFTTARWNHFVGTSDGATLKLYINGAAVTLSAGGNSPTTAATWCIGCRSSNVRTINGNMADVRFAKGIAWTAEEAAELYSSYFLPDIEMSALNVAAAADVLMPQIWM